MTIIEKIIAAHAKLNGVKPGDIVDIEIDVRLARDFGGANVVKVPAAGTRRTHIGADPG